MATARRQGTNVNVSTYDDTGSPDYTSLSAWESATDTDLVTADVSERLELQQNKIYAENSNQIFTGATTDADHRRTIAPASGVIHDGTNNGAGFSSTAALPLDPRESFFQFHDLVVQLSANSSGGARAIRLGASDTAAIGCIVDTPTNSGTGTTAGILGVPGSGNTFVIDCLVYDCDDSGIQESDGTMYVYNCTAINNADKNYVGSNMVAKNCIAQDGGNNDYLNVTTTTCLSSDTSGDFQATLTFVDKANDDYHLAARDLPAINIGTDLSADANYDFDDDIDQDSWSTTWAIGFDQPSIPAAGSSRVTGANATTSTYGGASRDYTSLSTWESATDNDLVTAAASEHLSCFDDSVFDDNVVITGATTNTTYFRSIGVASGNKHDGTKNTGVRFENTSINQAFDIQENNFHLNDLAVNTVMTSASNVLAGIVRGTTNQVVVAGCVFYDVANAGAGDGIGFQVQATDSAKIIDCIVFGCFDGIVVQASPAGTNTVLYNMTIASNDQYGINNNESSTIAKNILCDSNSTADFNGTFATGTTTNASGDATAPGTSARTNQTFTFVNAGNDNYHIATTDSGALGFGTDLSANTIYYAFTDDIDKEAWDATWNIGADQEAEMDGDMLSLLLLMRVG